ncbi:MAG: hypothetical protein MZV70_44735 [Desulfobacterales bacterium]|nr:hypothetical protein [Desulfobacterales bacterium]
MTTCCRSCAPRSVQPLRRAPPGSRPAGPGRRGIPWAGTPSAPVARMTTPWSILRCVHARADQRPRW